MGKLFQTFSDIKDIFSEYPGKHKFSELFWNKCYKTWKASTELLIMIEKLGKLFLNSSAKETHFLNTLTNPNFCGIFWNKYYKTWKASMELLITMENFSQMLLIWKHIFWISWKSFELFGHKWGLTLSHVINTLNCLCGTF